MIDSVVCSCELCVELLRLVPCIHDGDSWELYLLLLRSVEREKMVRRGVDTRLGYFGGNQLVTFQNRISEK